MNFELKSLSLLLYISRARSSGDDPTPPRRSMKHSCGTLSSALRPTQWKRAPAAAYRAYFKCKTVFSWIFKCHTVKIRPKMLAFVNRIPPSLINAFALKLGIWKYRKNSIDRLALWLFCRAAWELQKNKFPCLIGWVSRNGTVAHRSNLICLFIYKKIYEHYGEVFYVAKGR